MNVIEHETSMWRYADLFSESERVHRVSLGEGFTPVLDAPRLAASLGCKRLVIKDESQNPTGSFKDRSASYTVTKAVQEGAHGITLQSTGNAAASFAVYAARAGIACHAIVPADVLDINVEQILRVGARLTKLDDWRRASQFCAEVARDSGFTNVSAANTPHRAHAKRSLGFEIVEQSAATVPDAIFCPTGGGLALLSMEKAFETLIFPDGDVGFPRLFACQYSGCAPIARAYAQGANEVTPWGAIDTPRGGMRTPSPSLGARVLNAVSRGGAFAIAPQAAARLALDAARRDGLLVGLECGVALAALEAALKQGGLERDLSIMVINTAGPFKLDPEYMLSLHAGQNM
ncbi:pyridoxal-phosphate dependent enzyme [Pandoraea anhela]|uniref:Threonine synthase n=1 Tax=Pandoraea anhela TaxID=2508295 RepID=A0A5E4WI54_9BURK|nr:pyridoxal-phosphate dependent enzyme [Pandoraea anhela]VVE23519.1 Threonine synthase [Pandoraea anhela]